MSAPRWRAILEVLASASRKDDYMTKEEILALVSPNARRHVEESRYIMRKLVVFKPALLVLSTDDMANLEAAGFRQEDPPYGTWTVHYDDPPGFEEEVLRALAGETSRKERDR